MNEPILDSASRATQKDCCPSGAHGYKPEDPKYIPKGVMVTYGQGRTAYQVGKGNKAMIFLHDIFGLQTGLNKQICDQFAEELEDYVIIAPDFFPTGNPWANSSLSSRGGMAPLWFILSALFTCRLFSHVNRRMWSGEVEGIFNDTTTHLLSTAFTQGNAGIEVKSFALFGVCWGTYAAFKACKEATHRDKIVVNISIHPSVHSLADRYQDNEEAIINGVHCPQLVGSTKDEPPRWYPGGSVEGLLKAKEFGSKNEFYYYDVKHGFYTRGDTGDKSTYTAMQDFHDKTVSFLRRHHVA